LIPAGLEMLPQVGQDGDPALVNDAWGWENQRIVINRQNIQFGQFADLRRKFCDLVITEPQLSQVG